MNDREESNFSMKLAVDKELANNESAWILISQFKSAVEKYRLKLKQVVDERQIQEKQIKGITEEKASKKVLMCNLAVEVSAIVIAYACSINNVALKNVVNYSYSRLFRDRDTRARDRCLLIYNKAFPLALLLKDFGLGDTKLQELNDAIEAYVEVLSLPRTATGERKTSGVNIEALLKETDEILKNSIDNMMIPFKTSNQNFYKNYMSARMVIDSGHRFAKAISKIMGKVIDFESEAIIVNARVYFEGDEKNGVKSNEQGLFLIGAFKEGEKVLIAEKAGFKRCEEMLTIKKDEDQELNLEMEKDEVPVVPPEVL